MLSLLLALVLANSCAIAPADVPVFTNLNEHTGYYVYTISNKEGYVNDTDKLFFDELLSPVPLKWSQIKEDSIYVPSFSWGKIEAMILKLCKKQKQDCEAHGNPERKLQKFREVINRYRSSLRTSE